MEQALILGKISHRVPSDILEKIKKIKGVSEANLIFGPYDFYVTISTETKENMGDIAGDLASRRGRVQGQETLPGNMLVVKAQVPLAEVTQYNSQLKSVTAGRGSYSMSLSHYEAVPPNIQQQVVAQYAKRKEAE